jgi:hypothetical protein
MFHAAFADSIFCKLKFVHCKKKLAEGKNYAGK